MMTGEEWRRTGTMYLDSARSAKTLANASMAETVGVMLIPLLELCLPLTMSFVYVSQGLFQW